MRQTQLFVALATTAFCLAAFPAAKAADAPIAGAVEIDFEKDIQPLLAEHCIGCHGPKKQESNFRLDIRNKALAGGDYGEPAIVPGKADESPAYRYASGADKKMLMPPPGKGKPLSEKELVLFKAWIDSGAKWPDTLAGDPDAALTTTHWSFQPIKAEAPPAINDPWIARAIDAFILKKLQEAKLAPSPEADRVTLIRRLYLDMHGLLPTPEEVARFVDDKSPTAYADLVERVLESPRYGERWARHWLDTVRFAESNGFETNVERPNAWPYRDYVISAFNSDKPYNEFVREQLAGDALGADAATGFLVGGPYDVVKSPDVGLTLMQRQDELTDMVGVTGTSFLGLTVACARCHNHKFDPITQKDFYALQAVMAGVQHGERTMAPNAANAARLAKITEQITKLNSELAAMRPPLNPGRTILIDEQVGAPQAQALVKVQGYGDDAPGKQRGARDDEGGIDRLPNISGGQYAFFPSQPGADLFVYRPAATGRYRLWLSWGAGYATHNSDSVYLLDRDGDLATKNDQTELATIDQRHVAGAAASDVIASKALWSGFQDAGVVELKPESVVVLRGGKTGSATTADVVLLQEETDGVRPVVQPALREPVVSEANEERFAPTPARFVRFTIMATNSGAEPCLDELEVYTAAISEKPGRNVALASAGGKANSSGNFANDPNHKLSHVNDGKYGNSNSWISNNPGKGWVEIELPQVEKIDRIAWARDRDRKYSDRTAIDYKIEVAVEAGQWRTVATSRDRVPPGGPTSSVGYLVSGLPRDKAADVTRISGELVRLSQESFSLKQSGAVYGGSFVQPRPIHKLYRGDPLSPKEEVAPDAIAIVGSLKLAANAPERDRRLALADWIVGPTNPLTARVIVNRLWHFHFGTGIVDTPSDLGVNGSRPTHPELIDWMATELVRQKWSLKAMQREILLSSTYRQSSLPRKEALAVDAQTRLLWRYPPRRLEAEAIRDTVLETTGNLDLTMGGPGFMIFKPNSNYVRSWVWKDSYGPAEWRRMIYVHKIRMEQDDVFGAFDLPDAGQVCPKRSRSTTALQALNLLNGVFVIEQTELFAKRLTAEAGALPADQVKRAFTLAFSRAPDQVELQGGVQLIEAHGLPAFCRAIFNTNEFLFIP